MSFELEFLPSALKEWKKLDGTIRQQFRSKLAERLENPFVAPDKLSGHAQRYKIKLRSLGYRLVYEVVNERIVLLVVAVGKREKNEIYDVAAKR
ncbi:MAG: type II toxin-antitoxin system RelE family toxin [Janthinobacterium lividum]